MSNEILIMIFIMLCTYQCSQVLQKWRRGSQIFKSNQVSIFIGLLAGILAVLKYSRESVEELQRGQPFLFKVFLVPPILYET